MRVEELVDGAEVDGQRVDLAVMRGVHAVHVVREARETVHVVPDALVGGVEQVRAVLVDLRAGLLVHIRVGVATDVIADVDDVHTGTRMLHRLLRHRQAEQARTDNYQIRVLRALRRAVLRILRRICHDSKPFNRHVRFHTRFIVHQCSEKHLCTHAIPNSAAPIGFRLA